MNQQNFSAAVFAVALTAALAACGAPNTPDFAEKAAMSDMYEVEAGKIATQKGQSDQVKQFGQHMVEAHSKTTEELKALVKAENIKVELPTKLDSKHQGMIDDLNEAKPEDFDETYAKQQVNGHEDAVDLFEKYAKDGDNGNLKQFAQKTLPIIKEHLDMAKKLPGEASPPSSS
jgi:putative membrane protein